MSKRATSDNSSAVGLFPFLAVLLCTMGALLVLLVVLAQRVGQRSAAAKSQAAPTTETTAQPAVDPEEVAELARQLSQVRKYQQQLDELHVQGETRLNDEQQRLSHLEEHTRRLEHELAQLSLAAEQLEATEQNQRVDREQAKQELARLQQLIIDTETQLDDLRELAASRRSYAVVPYQGKNGTYAQPIYIVCDKNGITLQPEGLRFEPTDFVDPKWPGNPLAAALRASREHLKEKARRAGEPEPLDPYPLILVRPEGIKYYRVARSAIRSWDARFGYEFIDADWKLTYPELPDPQLARAQQHAVMIARERLLRLAQAAPSRFRGIAGMGGTGGTGYNPRGGYGSGGEGAGDESGDMLADSSEGDSRYGNGGTGGGSQDQGQYAGDPGQLSGDDEHQWGGLAGEASGGGYDGPAGSYAGSPGGESADGVEGAEGGSPSDAQLGQAGGTGGAKAGGTAGNAAGDASASSPGGSSGSLTGGAAGQQNGEITGPSLQFSARGSIADARGSDWAVQRAMRSAVPIRRPIQVVVRENQVALLPSRHTTEGAGATGAVISLDQSLEQISDEFAGALKTRVEEWGLAGNGLYWRPVLELRVGPEAGRTATQLIHLLKDSGVEVRLPETARSQQGEAEHAPR